MYTASCTHLLSDLPFAVSYARFRSTVHGLDHIGVFLTLLVLIFSGVAHASAPVQFSTLFFFFLSREEEEVRR